MQPKHLIVDGYNVLGAMGWPPGRIFSGGEHVLEDFLVRLSSYGQRIATPITVIFDAWRQPGSFRQVQHRAGITVMYSSQGERADQILQQLIRKYGKETGVVSSDHEILMVAKSYGAFMIRSPEFLSKISAKVHRMAGGRSAGRSLSAQEEEPGPIGRKEKKGNPRKLPKKMRERNRIMRRF